MKLADLLEEFNVVIDTSEGLTELRSLILGLAVRGKLVPQDSKDESASELLKKIEAVKKRLYEQGEIRKPKKYKEVPQKDTPFEIPNNWKWFKIANSGITQTGTTPKKSERKYWGNDYKFIKPANIGSGEINYESEGVSEIAVEKGKARLIKENSVLVVCIGTLGKTGFTKENVSCNQQINTVTPYSGIDYKFLYHVLTSEVVQNQYLDRATSTTIVILNKGNWEKTLIPLPPLAEQHRIVQKIELLFAEVDELEAKLNRQGKLDEKLQLAVNAEVQQAPDAEASKYAWSFITSNFDTLYHTPEAIDNLKKNILNEAVRGRLVPQNPNDAPASELLKKIETEKQRLYEDGEIRKPKDLPPVKEDEIPFEIPESWEWCRLGQISLTKGGKRLPKGHSLTTEPTDYIYLRVSDMQDGTIIDSDLHYIDEKTHEQIQKYKISKDDIYMTIVGATIGKCGLIPERFSGSNLTENAVKITPIIIDKDFLYQLLDMPLSQEQFIDKTKQVGVQKMAIFRLKNTLLTLPPIEEQHRIVQRIEELFTICDRFKAQLEQREKVNERLVKGLVGEVLEKAGSSEKEPVHKIEISVAAEPNLEYKSQHKKEIPILGPPEDSYFVKRKMLGCYIINQSLKDKNFGDTKFEKLLHLADYWAVQRNLNQRYYQKAAGPYDNAFTKQFFNQVLRAKWYRKISQGNLNRIIAGTNQEKSTNYYGYFSEDEFQWVDKLIRHFRKYTYVQPEIISTLYAVWNNRIIRKQPVNDQLLMQDFLDWDKNKEKYKDRLDGALDWMRSEGIVPNGWGKIIEKPKKN